MGIIFPLKQLEKTAIVCRIIFACCDVKCCTEAMIRLENVIQGFGICISAVAEVF